MLKFGAAMFFTDYSMTPGELGKALEERGFEIGLGAGALAHSAIAQDGAGGRWRTGEEDTMTPWTRSSR